ncbi:MAG TPA: FAD-dependent oxidoreductase [Verrucomicrobiae bacterium]|nr:FAD-dependent oxidoreductase [Verrucomicrobiae bacterium]
MKGKPHVVVVGAGAFGGWTALHLLEGGARVTLIDAWGPGNSRSSSGGETRVMRGTYGPDQPYTDLAARALKLWAKYERRWRRQVLQRSGVLWLASGHDAVFERGSVEMLRAARIKYQELSSREMRKRWPQINFAGVDWAILEPECGYLDARASCQAVVEAFLAAGGKYRQVRVSNAGMGTSLSEGIKLLDNERSRLIADCYVFACGPWMGAQFPAIIGKFVRSTKQDVFFFGPPARAEAYFTDAHLPVWADHRDHFYYGIPGRDHRGFKIADDTRGPEFDPTDGERIVSQETLEKVREYLAFRFPALKDAPLVETRVCQYEQTPDGHFIVDRHPNNENLWLLGGGSGHGFKHGPAIGEMMADLILKETEPPAVWRLGRFGKK